MEETIKGNDDKTTMVVQSITIDKNKLETEDDIVVDDGIPYIEIATSDETDKPVAESPYQKLTDAHDFEIALANYLMSECTLYEVKRGPKKNIGGGATNKRKVDINLVDEPRKKFETILHACYLECLSNEDAISTGLSGQLLFEISNTMFNSWVKNCDSPDDTIAKRRRTYEHAFKKTKYLHQAIIKFVQTLPANKNKHEAPKNDNCVKSKETQENPSERSVDAPAIASQVTENVEVPGRKFEAPHHCIKCHCKGKKSNYADLKLKRERFQKNKSHEAEIQSENVAGYRGDAEVDELLKYIDPEEYSESKNAGKNKKNQKSSEKRQKQKTKKKKNKPEAPKNDDCDKSKETQENPSERSVDAPAIASQANDKVENKKPRTIQDNSKSISTLNCAKQTEPIEFDHFRDNTKLIADNAPTSRTTTNIGTQTEPLEFSCSCDKTRLQTEYVDRSFVTKQDRLTRVVRQIMQQNYKRRLKEQCKSNTSLQNSIVRYLKSEFECVASKAGTVFYHQ